VIALWRDRPTAWRIIKSLNPITVRLGGYSNYIVRPDEVLESREIDKPDAVQVS